MPVKDCPVKRCQADGCQYPGCCYGRGSMVQDYMNRHNCSEDEAIAKTKGIGLFDPR